MEKQKMTFNGGRWSDSLFLTYIRKVPNHPFKLRIVNRINDIFFNNSVKIKCENDATFNLSSREQIGGGIMFLNEYEPDTLKMCREALKDGGVFLDIGANIGLFSIYLSTIDNVTVYAVEPSAQNFLKFLDNLRVNKSTNVVPVNVGLSYKDAFGYMVNQSPKNSGTIKVVENMDGPGAYLIRLCTLAELVQHLAIKEVQLLKIDVEGYEMNVFKGFFTAGNTVMPKNIVMEFGDQIERTGYKLPEAFDYFINLGYKAYDVNGLPYVFGADLQEGNLWLKYQL